MAELWAFLAGFRGGGVYLRGPPAVIPLDVPHSIREHAALGLQWTGKRWHHVLAATRHSHRVPNAAINLFSPQFQLSSSALLSASLVLSFCLCVCVCWFPVIASQKLSRNRIFEAKA